MRESLNGIFTLQMRDVVKGLIVAVLATVFAWLMQIFNAEDFSFATINWGELGRVTVAAAVAYIAKNFLSDNHGRVLGTETILGVKQ